MVPSIGYNRTVRKLLHIFGGLGGLVLPFIPYWLALAAALAGMMLALLLKPNHSRWLRVLAKPEDRNRGVITGLRGYCFVILLLILLWPPLELVFPDAVHFVMLGWLVLAFGDGLAGLVGPHPRVSRTVPWNKRKTWWGLGASFVGTLAAFAMCFCMPWPGLVEQSLAQLVSHGLIIGVIVSLVESLKTPVDDNYLVGLGSTLVAALLRLLSI